MLNSHSTFPFSYSSFFSSHCGTIRNISHHKLEEDSSSSCSGESMVEEGMDKDSHTHNNCLSFSIFPPPSSPQEFLLFLTEFPPFMKVTIPPDPFRHFPIFILP